MLKKIVTTVGLVSVFGASTAFAVQDLSATAATYTPLNVGNETLSTAAASVTAGAGANLGTTFSDVVGAGTALDFSMKAGFNGATTGGSDYFIKVELTNAAYSTAAGAMSVTNPGGGGKVNIATSTLFSGGTVGSSSAIYQFDISDPITATATLSTTLVDIGTNGNPTVKMSIFETLTEANKAAGSAVSTASKQLLTLAPGLKRTVTPKTETAEVSKDFKKYFVSAGVENLIGEMGSVTHTITTGTPAYIDAADGSALVLSNLYTPATTVATFTGDLSNGVWWMSKTGCVSAATAANKLTLNAAKTAGTTTGTVFDTNEFLCNSTLGVATIPASAYTIGINYSIGDVAKSAGAADVTGVVIGSIARNGTNQNINYLTTFASYNQRVFITNRGTVDATYTFTFQSEAGVTATAGTAATGTSKAGSVLALKASDIVTLTGKTRTAASLTIVGTPAFFSIATQQVNLSNGATDTVIYKE